MCQLCWKREETIFHCLWDCKVAKKVWALDSNFLKPIKVHYTDLASLFLEGVDKLNGNLIDWFLIVAWKIWSARNIVVMEKKLVEASIVFQRAASFYQEWLQCLEVEQGPQSIRTPGRWSSPL